MEGSMSSSTESKQTISAGTAPRVLREGYGPGAWHGPDLKAALEGTPAAIAFWRPRPGRHNIAEIALHHAFYVRSVRAQLSGRPAEPFVLPGEDWFEVGDNTTITWRDVTATVDAEQRRLAQLVDAIEAGAAPAAAAVEEQFGLVLGITCHAIYHAGQIELIRRLHAE
jgi:hypothetical protein